MSSYHSAVVRGVFYGALLWCTNLVYFTHAIPVDNGVISEPEIECGPTALAINFNTAQNFQGKVFVKGLFDHSECRNDVGGRKAVSLALPFDSCNVARSRSLNPRGIFVHATVVIMFHPLFITKVDRAYRIQCFYMEADKTVSTQIEVSAITTAFATQLVPMPICRYEILENNPAGRPIQYALIGQQVYHKWTCDSETIDTFCAVVHTCTVDDGNGDTVQILDDDGCAVDKYLLNNLEYPTDLMAGQEAHVYKYADRSELYYQCQISITVKEPNSECPRPQCSEPQGFGAVKSASAPAPAASPLSPGKLRLIKKRAAIDDNIVDVRADLSAVDISDQKPILPDELRYQAQLANAGYPVSAVNNARNSNICVSQTGLALFAVLAAGFAVTLILCATLLHTKRSAKH